MESFKEWFIKKNTKEHQSPKWCLDVYQYYIDHLVNEGVHNGDCIGEPQSCALCLLENNLQEYYTYTKQTISNG